MPYFKVNGRWNKDKKPGAFTQLIAKDAEAAIRKAKRQGILADDVSLVESMSFVVHVAGASHDNRDGSSRQSVILRCLTFERLQLVQETNNPHDKHAIRIHRFNGEQLGYVPKHDAHEIYEGFFAAGGCVYTAWSIRREPLGGTDGLHTLRIGIVVGPPTTHPSRLLAEIQSVLKSWKCPVLADSLLPAQTLESAPMPQVIRGSPVTHRSMSEIAKKRQSGCLLLAAAVVVSLSVSMMTALCIL